MKFSLLLFCFCCFSIPVAFGQCPAGYDQVRLKIDPDEYFTEVSWRFTNLDGSVIYAAGYCTSEDSAVYNYCIPDNGCTVFRIMDDYGDGMEPDGYYRLFVNDTLIHENIGGDYNFGENIHFGCPPGSFCDQPFVADTGLWVSPAGLEEKWYSFTPADTGTYQISTCFAENGCPTKIWLYDHCAGITLSNNQTGANFYANGGCTDGALATVYLAGGQTYFIRFRYADTTCLTEPIHFALYYTGPVIGCMDPTACNYNPLASISGDCMYPGNPDCPNAPDLVVLEDELRNSLSVDVLNTNDGCAVDEGCLRGTGQRHLVRFTTHIKNIGNQDYFIGPPPSDPATPSTQFVWDPCHNHWHYRGYAEYVLYNQAGLRLPIGSKNGFCVLDLECNDGGIGKYSCGYMGITSNCGDIYDSGLDCQWVDITDLPEDIYTLVVRVNWDKSPDQLGRIEKTYENNWAQACFSLSYPGSNNNPEIEFLDNNCPEYYDCSGEIFGDAQPDCEGICNGPVLYGDWDHSAARDTADLHAYLEAALSADSTLTTCKDLFADNRFDIYDAALLDECEIFGNDLNHWGVRYPCQFPAGLSNQADIVRLSAGVLDTLHKTFTVRVVNPNNKLIAYDFAVSGLVIDSIENLAPGFTGDIHYNNALGRIVALSTPEHSIYKNTQPANLLRIHYQQITAPQICIASVRAVVNSKYQKSAATVGTPACTQGLTSATQTPEELPFVVTVQPNPFRDRAVLSFNNPDAESLTITLQDLTGKTLRVVRDVRSESVVLERGNLPAGLYRYNVQYSRGMVSGKVVAW